MPDSKASIAKQSSGSSLLGRLTEVDGDKPWSDPLVIVLVVGANESAGTVSWQTV